MSEQIGSQEKRRLFISFVTFVTFTLISFAILYIAHRVR